MSVTEIQAFKRCDDPPGCMVACGRDDPDANRFVLASPGMWFGSCVSLEFTNLHRAEQVARAIERAHEAGKRAAMAELRAFIGC